MRSRYAVALTASLALVLLSFAPQLLRSGADGAAPSTARVGVNQSYPVPGNGRYTVRGHGYGHGHGMSQWGAQGAALAGQTYRQILRFYYPGTDLANAARKVRVLITADTTSDVVVLARSGLRLRDRGAGRTYDLPTNGATRWRVTVGSGNNNVVDYQEGSTWHRWRPGGAAALQGEGEFRAPGPIALVKPNRTTRYHGFLRAAKASPGSTSRDTVNVVTLDQYVKGVVPSEVYTSWRPAALQAQAVAARTYAAFERAAHEARHYQICDTTACQVYGGVDEEVASTNAAVEATAREILTYGGEPAFTQFSASSGGWTSAGNFPYLPAKADPYDDTASNPAHDWQETLSAATIRNRYPSLGTLRRIRVTDRNGHGQWQGRVVRMVLDGSRNDVVLSGDSFRSDFGLRSNWFSFS